MFRWVKKKERRKKKEERRRKKKEEERFPPISPVSNVIDVGDLV